MNISLIGMSNSGKSYWSTKLAKAGYRRFCIDDLLEEKLEIGLKLLGYKGINDLAKWMRQPYEERNVRTSSTYLEYEKKTMNEVLAKVEKADPDDNVIIDTTGSVIYTGSDILQKLSALTIVVYLETPKEVQQQMYESYIKNPKPVIWGESFKKKNGESNLEALKRCYPKLLAYRSQQYKKLANISIPYKKMRNDGFTTESFLAIIQK